MARRGVAALLATLVLPGAAVIALPAGALAEQASQPGSAAAGQLDVSAGTDDGSGHTCARLGAGSLRCWGSGGSGRLGYGNTATIGDDESPGSVGPVSLGSGRTTTAISAGSFHGCALLDDASVRCWGFGGDGRLGYANTSDVGDDESAGARGPVSVGGATTAISTGGGHTCALLTGGSVRCWGYGRNGRLGNGSRSSVGDNETPGSVAPVNLGSGRTARAISAGGGHSCALLDNGSVRCWGYAGDGRLGYGDINNDIGDNEAPASVGPVGLGDGRSARAISAGADHTCALLDDGSVRCWGFGGNGRLGYGNAATIGDDEAPGSAGPVDLGPGRSAKAISAGDDHTCALLDDGSVRCWGFGGDGRLGYGNTQDVGDDETPGSVTAVDLGSGESAVAISAGGRHTCALLDEGKIRCWGAGATGRLGYCAANDIGDDETPASAGPVDVTGSSSCGARAVPPGLGGPPPASADPVPPSPADSAAERRRARYRRALAGQGRRKRALRSCNARVRRHAARELRSLRRSSARARVPARRHVRRHRSRGSRACLRRFGRTPGRVGRLTVRTLSRGKALLSFHAPGTDGRRPPAARGYLIKHSRGPIRSGRHFRRASRLCRGQCRFNVRLVGDKIELVVRGLRPRHIYYYSVAARDNVSGRPGRRSPTAKVQT